MPSGTVRLYEVSGQCSTEAGLLQLNKPGDKLESILFVTIILFYLIRYPLSACLRSRGCFALHDLTGNRLFVWKGVKASNILKQSTVTAAQKLNERYCLLVVVS